jgi:predicted nucleic acid-binding protein
VSAFVLDASVTLSWCYKTALNESSAKVFEATAAGKAIVPAIWSYEVTNFMATAIRTRRMNENERNEFIGWLIVQPISVERSLLPRLLRATLAIADRFGLSGYDAAYIELAIREQLPLATFDQGLRRAAEKGDVPLLC